MRERIRDEMAVRIGLFGGSCDPVHCGHLIAARSVAEELSLEGVIFLPRARSHDKGAGGLLGWLKGRHGMGTGERRDVIEVAHGNGLLAIGATYGYGSPEELVAADATIASFDELPAMVETLLAAN